MTGLRINRVTAQQPGIKVQTAGEAVLGEGDQGWFWGVQGTGPICWT